MPVGRMSPGRSVSSNRSLHQRPGRRGAAGLADSDGYSEPAAKIPAPDVDSVQMPGALREPRANKPPLVAGTSCPRGRGDIRGRSNGGCSGLNCRPATAKWAAHAHSQGFGPVRHRRLPRDGRGACHSTCPGQCVACLLAPLATPKWPTAASPQGSALTTPHF